jgi:hypothetical protein
MKKIFVTISNALIGGIIFSGFVLVSIYPYKPATPFAWCFLIAAAAPIVLGLQVVGNFVLQDRITRHMGKTGKLLFLFIVLVLVMLLILLVWHWVAPGLVKWTDS